jgi:hypothetical protein
MAQVTLNLSRNFLPLGQAVEYLVARGVVREQAVEAVVSIIRRHRAGDLHFPGDRVRFGSKIKWKFGDGWLETNPIDIANSTIVAPGQGWMRTELLLALIEVAVAALDELLAQAQPRPQPRPRARQSRRKSDAHKIEDDDACYWYHELLRRDYRPKETQLVVAKHMLGSLEPESKAKRLERKYPKWCQRHGVKRKGA